MSNHSHSYVGDGEYDFSSYGFYMKKLNYEELVPIRSEVNLIRDNFASAVEFQSKLAGNISREYKLETSTQHTENIVASILVDWSKTHPDIFGNQVRLNWKESALKLRSLWVNFQRKYEFNPLHNHSGVFSFVLWLDIPYTMDEELDLSPGKQSNKPTAGCFEFSIPSPWGLRNHMIPVDKSYNGIMCVFPSSLYHQVYPFYSSDDYRITVSGNMYFDEEV